MREIDPKIFGPGTWSVIHVLGIVCDESGKIDDYKFYALFVHRVLHALPCGNCRKHSVRYLNKNPLPKTPTAGPLFDWSVKFHNAVNTRLKKSKMSLEDARVCYSNTEIVLVNPEKTSMCTIGLGLPSSGESSGCEDGAL